MMLTGELYWDAHGLLSGLLSGCSMLVWMHAVTSHLAYVEASEAEALCL